MGKSAPSPLSSLGRHFLILLLLLLSLLLPHIPPRPHQPTLQADVCFISSFPFCAAHEEKPLISFNRVLSLLADLENFKTRTRSTVSVRQGQGMVLLCGPPPHSGGKGPFLLFISASGNEFWSFHSQGREVWGFSGRLKQSPARRRLWQGQPDWGGCAGWSWGLRKLQLGINADKEHFINLSVNFRGELMETKAMCSCTEDMAKILCGLSVLWPGCVLC